MYCFPFVYFSMYQDFKNKIILGYLIMVVATAILAFFSKLFGNSITLITGNILSMIVSFFLIKEMAGNEQWENYFKPLTPNQLLILVSVLNLIPQFLTIILANRYKRKLYN